MPRVNSLIDSPGSGAFRLRARRLPVLRVRHVLQPVVDLLHLLLAILLLDERVQVVPEITFVHHGKKAQSLSTALKSPRRNESFLVFAPT